MRIRVQKFGYIFTQRVCSNPCHFRRYQLRPSIDGHSVKWEKRSAVKLRMWKAVVVFYYVLFLTVAIPSCCWTSPSQLRFQIPIHTCHPCVSKHSLADCILFMQSSTGFRDDSGMGGCSYRNWTWPRRYLLSSQHNTRDERTRQSGLATRRHPRPVLLKKSFHGQSLFFI